MIIFLHMRAKTTEINFINLMKNHDYFEVAVLVFQKKRNVMFFQSVSQFSKTFLQINLLKFHINPALIIDDI